MRFWGKDRKQDNRKNIWIEHLNIDTGNWLALQIHKVELSGKWNTTKP